MSRDEEGWRRRLENMKKLSSELNIREELHTNSLQFSLLERGFFLKFFKLLNIIKAQTGPQENRNRS